VSGIEQKYIRNLAELRIPSGKDIMVGRMHIAEGKGPHPTIVMLHGFPGVMMNLDIAADLQHNGWNVLVISYRGAWGSKGCFSFSNALEDVRSTLEYIKREEVADTNRIDRERVALVGHSFGGFLALLTAVQDPSIKVIASLSGANFGLFANMAEQNPDMESQFRGILDDGCFFLNGCTADIIIVEVMKNKDDWNTFIIAPALADRRILLTATTDDEELPKEHFHDPLVQILEHADAKNLSHEVFESNHNYTNKRKELGQLLDRWLEENL